MKKGYIDGDHAIVADAESATLCKGVKLPLTKQWRRYCGSALLFVFAAWSAAGDRFTPLHDWPLTK